MSKRKGLSINEKKDRLLSLFNESKDVFQLKVTIIHIIRHMNDFKELEKRASKEKGIAIQSVKEVLEALVDDGYVDTDKIGTSIYYWAFPSKISSLKKKKMQQLEQQLKEVKQRKINIEECIFKLKKDADNDSLTIMLDNLEMSKNKLRKLKEDLKNAEDSNPEIIKRLQNEIEIAKCSANDWTDNLFTLMSWCNKQFCIEQNILRQQFNIPEDLDYL